MTYDSWKLDTPARFDGFNGPHECGNCGATIDAETHERDCPECLRRWRREVRRRKAAATTNH